ncbi:hypothetical protein VitviT2T_007325 [Vitis vinifera]|uniref:Vesicle transport protein GOT1 n=1 Tax=Vitis vinifera TaxID=29760 RepID=A0ABY9BYU9_VITVI|nr:hypothetical protein VitviT2T_007325 [Vitis vinifera]
MAYEMTEQKRVGLGLIGFGIFFTFLGVILFFDRGLLALGNIFWLTGVALLIGWRSTWNLFSNRANYKGSISFLLGLFLIFVRWPIVGVSLSDPCSGMDSTVLLICFLITSGGALVE